MMGRKAMKHWLNRLLQYRAYCGAGQFGERVLPAKKRKLYGVTQEGDEASRKQLRTLMELITKFKWKLFGVAVITPENISEHKIALILNYWRETGYLDMWIWESCREQYTMVLAKCSTPAWFTDAIFYDLYSIIAFFLSLPLTTRIEYESVIESVQSEYTITDI